MIRKQISQTYLLNASILVLFMMLPISNESLKPKLSFNWNEIAYGLKKQFNSSHVNNFIDIIEDELNPFFYQKNRVIGGKVAKIGTFAFHVSLAWTLDNAYLCGGVLITRNHVLTAAHCVISDYGWNFPPEDFKLIAGRTFLNETGKVRYVKHIAAHPNYIAVTKQNDIAVIETTMPFKLSDRVNTIPLINYRVPPLTKCTTVGFGATNLNGPPTTNHLMKVTVPVQSMLRCRLSFLKREKIYDGMLCAGYFTGNRDACSGDSGGPFICDNKLAGIVSAGIGCGNFYNPGIYSDIVYFRKFIKSVLVEFYTTPSNTRNHNTCNRIMLAMKTQFRRISINTDDTKQKRAIPFRW